MDYGDSETPVLTGMLQEVLRDNPGMAKVFNLGNTQIMRATPERERPYYLEFWVKGDSGTPSLPPPTGGKTNVLELYKKLGNDPATIKNAIYGDLLHGMATDPYYKSLRDQFIKAYTPQELKRIKEKQSWWDDANGGAPLASPAVTDAYIRGWLSPGEHASAVQGQRQSGNTMYSAQQLLILKKMEQYIKTGRR